MTTNFKGMYTTKCWCKQCINGGDHWSDHLIYIFGNTERVCVEIRESDSTHREILVHVAISCQTTSL